MTDKRIIEKARELEALAAEFPNPQTRAEILRAAATLAKLYADALYAEADFVLASREVSA